mmetsp:Transcript_62300/g.148734  ORF Transcript_62300/g.148734 Transcript_62300/m.148734 type:complete len:137 (+) Transcript_62300:55-465(+)
MSQALDDDDLDDEDRAILAEVKKKGYYHGRPPSQATETPKKLEDADLAPPALPTGKSRHEFDEYQKKWDRFDKDDYLNAVEKGTAVKANKAAEGAKPAHVEAAKTPALSNPAGDSLAPAPNGLWSWIPSICSRRRQ